MSIDINNQKSTSTKTTRILFDRNDHNNCFKVEIEGKIIHLLSAMCVIIHEISKTSGIGEDELLIKLYKAMGENRRRL